MSNLMEIEQHVGANVSVRPRKATPTPAPAEQPVKAILQAEINALSTAVLTPVEQPGKAIFIQFRDYPELYLRLTEIARSEFRSPEQEALYLLSRELTGPLR